MKKKYEFDVALSFAGEDRKYVECVADELKDMGFKVFYDKYETVSLWGKDLYAHISDIYFKKARYVVIFISEHYKKKLWTNHERRSAQARAIAEKREYILPVKFDSTEIPGILPTIGYISIDSMNATDFAQLVKEKIAYYPRTQYFPSNPDLYYKSLGIKSKRDKNAFLKIANSLFESLELMTFEERYTLFTLNKHTCANALPNNIHHKLEYISRVLRKSPEKVISIFQRLDCLYFKTIVSKGICDQDDKDSKETIAVSFSPCLVNVENCEETGTVAMNAVFNCISETLCPDCQKKAIRYLDFSTLSTKAGINENKS